MMKLDPNFSFKFGHFGTFKSALAFFEILYPEILDLRKLYAPYQYSKDFHAIFEDSFRWYFSFLETLPQIFENNAHAKFVNIWENIYPCNNLQICNRIGVI